MYQSSSLSNKSNSLKSKLGVGISVNRFAHCDMLYFKENSYFLASNS